jgi:hypothetical protein
MERWSYKPEVEGLSPSSGTREQTRRHGDAENARVTLSVSPRHRVSVSLNFSGRGACSSAESEHLSSKQKVAGSNPAGSANVLRSSSSLERAFVS